MVRRAVRRSANSFTPRESAGPGGGRGSFRPMSSVQPTRSWMGRENPLDIWRATQYERTPTRRASASPTRGTRVRWRDYELGDTISKIAEDTKPWESDKGIVEIRKNTLAIPIRLDDDERGYIFHGEGKLLLDTIVETEKGAIGRPVERELDSPFLMLGNSEKMRQNLDEASQEDFVNAGYKDRQEFLDTAEALFDRFFQKGKIHGRRHFKRGDGLIFAFQNQASTKLDVLIAKDSKLVYASKAKVFVAHRDNVVLTSPGAVVCSGKGKSVIINKGRSVVIRDSCRRA